MSIMLYITSCMYAARPVDLMPLLKQSSRRKQSSIAVTANITTCHRVGRRNYLNKSVAQVKLRQGWHSGYEYDLGLGNEASLATSTKAQADQQVSVLEVRRGGELREGLKQCASCGL